MKERNMWWLMIILLDKVLNRIKETIGFEKFDNTQLLVDTDDKLPGGIILI